MISRVIICTKVAHSPILRKRGSCISPMVEGKTACCRVLLEMNVGGKKFRSQRNKVEHCLSPCLTANVMKKKVWRHWWKKREVLCSLMQMMRWPLLDRIFWLRGEAVSSEVIKSGREQITFSFLRLALDIIGRCAICAFKWTYAALRLKASKLRENWIKWRPALSSLVTFCFFFSSLCPRSRRRMQRKNSKYEFCDYLLFCIICMLSA